MSFSAIADGSAVFIDANIFIYAFAPNAVLGVACIELLKRIEQGDLKRYTSALILSDVAHRLMTLEACLTFVWPYAGILSKLKRQPAELARLVRYRQEVESVARMGVNVLPVHAGDVIAAMSWNQSAGLLSNDALVVALMQGHGLTQLASHDADFDRVPGITRFAPA